MFTGLIEEIGVIEAVAISDTGIKITIGCHRVLEEMSIGDSIAINGICLTAVVVENNSFTADVMKETIDKTNISLYKKNTLVNLERALAVGSRMGGHFVQGHVDGIGVLKKRTPIGNAMLFQFCVSPELAHWMVQKGSISVNGISLTLVVVGDDFFTVSIIPHTLVETNLGQVQEGDIVNIECDIVGKYLAKWATSNEKVSM